MNVAIVTIGTQGDMQPFVSLGMGLMRAGHAVKVLTHEPFREFVCAHRLQFSPLSGDPRMLLNSEQGLLVHQHSLTSHIRHLSQLSGSIALRVLEEIGGAIKESDVIISNLLALFGTYHYAEKMKVPLFVGTSFPVSPTDNFPCASFGPSWLRLGKRYNRLTYRIAERILLAAFREPMNRIRTEIIGLPPMPPDFSYYRLHGRPVPIMYNFSESLLSRPQDWGDYLNITGFWNFDSPPAWQMSARLAAILRRWGASNLYRIRKCSNR